MENIESNVIKIKELISTFEEKYHRPLKSVQLLCASKGQPIDKMREAIKAGLHTFGENYLQEALEKMQALQQEKIEWHFIGKIQHNKANKIANAFNWVQTIDTIEIAKRLNDAREGDIPLNCLIQVNISRESSKSGVAPENVLSLAKTVQLLPNLRLRGLMAIPAPQTSMTLQREACHQLLLLWENLKMQGLDIDTLSVGMSSDFEAAIAEGSTMVRIGSALLGERT